MSDPDQASYFVRREVIDDRLVLSQVPIWPSGCKNRGACERHRSCQYAGCVHEKQNISGQVIAEVHGLRAPHSQKMSGWQHVATVPEGYGAYLAPNGGVIIAKDPPMMWSDGAWRTLTPLVVP